MLIKTQTSIPPSEITDPPVFYQRRTIIKAAMASLLMGNAGTALSAVSAADELDGSSKDTERLTPTPFELVKNYTNYYEFAFNKEDATHLAQSLEIEDWSVTIEGEVEAPGRFHLEDILARHPVQEYIYRMRCVEGWSMVVPWQGFSLAALLKSVRPLSSAKFVKFTALYRPHSMPKQKTRAMLDWPYVEALRIDEAMHPLTILAVGMYGQTLPKQNGAPLRLVVPWKYGFKSIKAITRIELTSKPPLTSWNQFAPNEYGFYANVNPDVAHPRWSQRSERQLASGFFTPRRATELFNGYAEQVASLYSGMDLKHFF